MVKPDFDERGGIWAIMPLFTRLVSGFAGQDKYALKFRDMLVALGDDDGDMCQDFQGRFVIPIWDHKDKFDYKECAKLDAIVDDYLCPDSSASA